MAALPPSGIEFSFHNESIIPSVTSADGVPCGAQGNRRRLTERGRPASPKVDNGPEFAGRLLDRWAYLEKVELDFSRPGKPTDNGHIEAFNGRLRAECLNASWFLSTVDAKDRIEEWRIGYSQDRPHMALGGLTPASYAKHDQTARKVA